MDMVCRYGEQGGSVILFRKEKIAVYLADCTRPGGVLKRVRQGQKSV